MPGTTIRIEAENMDLNGYRLERSNSFDFASGKAYTSLYAEGDNETATATTLFDGASGNYDIVVAYFDEDDGVSSFKLEHERNQIGQQIGQWKATNTTGGALPSAQSLARRTFSNISLKTGDTLRLTGTESLKEAARIDYIELIARDTTSDDSSADAQNDQADASNDSSIDLPNDQTVSGDPIRVEVESMDLNGYRLEQGNSLKFASGKAYVSLYAQGEKETATATTQFSGATGKYDIVVAYFDENDGVSSFELSRGDSVIGQWRAESTTGGALPSAQSLVKRTFSNVSLTNGDRIRLTGTEDDKEAARIDYIEFVPKGSTSTPPTGSLAGSNGIFEIMALGDSITRGEDATTAKSSQNGYRDDLASKLNSAGIRVDFVGSLKNGSGFDADHEGHGGWKINQIADNVSGWLQSYSPEIILLHAGTNDLGFSTISVGEVLNRLGSLIDRIISKRPASKLLVSSVTPTDPSKFSNKDIVAGFQNRVAEFNQRLPDFIKGKSAQVKFVDAGGSISATQDISSDGFHPDDSGYSKIANAFFSAIQDVIGSSATNSSQNASSQNTTSSSDITGNSDTLNNSNDPLNLDEATGFTTRNGNRLKGSGKVDNITGTADNEEFRGLLGNDILTGGGGMDIFAFGNLRHGVDTITDFGKDDIIQITARTFGGGLRQKTNLQTSASSTGVFVSGDNPISLGQSANFLYNERTQTLLFDRDGTGDQYGAVEIAKLSGVSSLSANQIQIV